MNIEKIKEIIKIDFREAVFEGDHEKVKLLLDAGVNPNKFNDDDPEGDWTPLMYAVGGMHFLTAKYLIEAGANMDVILIDGDRQDNLFELIETNSDDAEMKEAMKTFLTRTLIKKHYEKKHVQAAYK